MLYETGKTRNIFKWLCNYLSIEIQFIIVDISVYTYYNVEYQTGFSLEKYLVTWSLDLLQCCFVFISVIYLNVIERDNYIVSACTSYWMCRIQLYGTSFILCRLLKCNTFTQLMKERKKKHLIDKILKDINRSPTLADFINSFNTKYISPLPRSSKNMARARPPLTKHMWDLFHNKFLVHQMRERK